MLTIEAVLIILTTVILILFLYYRNAPEIKATSPYLSLTMFVGCYSLFAGAIIRVISYSVIHDGVFFCNAPKWCLSLGIYLIFAPLIMKMLRVYRIFTYFGKMSKRWSDIVLLTGTIFIVGANIIFVTVWIAFGGVKGMNTEVLVTPENSFPYYEVIQTCILPNVINVVYLIEVAILYTIVVLLAILTRNIRRQHFKDTKKVNIFIYSEVLISYILFPLSLIITDPEIQVYLTFAEINSHAVLCQMFLFLPKVSPPLSRDLQLKYWKTSLKNKQSTTSDEENTLITPMLLQQ